MEQTSPPRVEQVLGFDRIFHKLRPPKILTFHQPHVNAAGQVNRHTAQLALLLPHPPQLDLAHRLWLLLMNRRQPTKQHFCVVALNWRISPAFDGDSSATLASAWNW